MASASISSGASKPNHPVLRRTVTSTTATDSAESSAAVSPSDSPRHSASSTSLSSLSSVDIDAAKKASEYANLVDTNGNKFTPPDFTIKELRDAIPKHCFERSAIRGWSYILRDMVCLATTFYLFHNYVTPENVPSKPARAVLWGVYTALQGLFATGIWVIAHECGHQAFSPSKLINDTTGWLLHSALFVPYFSWKLSHSAHHKGTGNIEKDMVFNPKTRPEYANRVGRMVHEISELTEETPIFTITMLVLQQLVGWPNYLMTNVTGHNYHERQREGRGEGKHNGLGGGVNHFDPRSPIYDNKHTHLIILSDIGLLLNLGLQVYLGNTFGWKNMLVWFWVPWLWVNHWLGKFCLLFIPELCALLTISQSPSPTSSTPIPPCPITPTMSGTLSVVRALLSIARWDSSVVICYTASSRRMSCTTMSAPFPSTMRTRLPRPSSLSWASITDRIPRTALGASCALCTPAPVHASGWSRARMQRALARESSSTGIATELESGRPS